MPRVAKKKTENKRAPKGERSSAVKRAERVSTAGESAPALSAEEKTPRYFEGIGRRKTAVAKVRLFTQGDKIFLVNDKPCDKYFPTAELKQIVLSSLEKMNCIDRFRVLANVRGGGIHAQAEAVRHGISRALVLFNQEFRKRLRRAGYLTRDPRMRERKKFGLKRARRAPQWQKR